MTEEFLVWIASAHRLAQLKRKLRKRQGEPGFAANVGAIEAQMAELEALLNG